MKHDHCPACRPVPPRPPADPGVMETIGRGTVKNVYTVVSEIVLVLSGVALGFGISVLCLALAYSLGWVR